MTKNQKGELIFNLFLLGLMSFLFAGTLKFKEVNISKDMIGTTGFPRVVLVLIIAIVAFQTLKLIRTKIEKETVKKKNIQKSLTAILLILSYIVLLNYLGYVFITPVAIILLAYGMGYRNIKMLAIFSILTTVLLVILFGIFFSVPLPRGILFFREISYYIY